MCPGETQFRPDAVLAEFDGHGLGEQDHAGLEAL